MNKLQTNTLSKKLYQFDDYFDYLRKLYESKKFPKVILLTGKRGLGKMTLIFHFINYLFSKDTYDLKNKLLDTDSKIYLDITNGISENFIYLKNENKSKVGIDEIRNLKNILLKSSLNNKKRFIILDNVEEFNINSSNALLKIIEEPTENNYFILIDSQQAQLLQTIASRCFNINFYLDKAKRASIIENLIKSYNIEKLIEYKNSDITPGDFFHYNNLCIENDINPKFDYISKINKLLNLYKKSKNKTFINISIFFTEQFFYKLLQEE